MNDISDVISIVDNSYEKTKEAKKNFKFFKNKSNDLSLKILKTIKEKNKASV